MARDQPHSTKAIYATSSPLRPAKFVVGSKELSQQRGGRMTEQAEDPATAPETPEMVEVTVSVPARLLADYDRGVASGFYASRDEALRHGLTESWRHHRGRYCTVRLDLLDPADKRPDTGAEDQPETTEPKARGAGDTATE
jgi:Arc/MetJ-type ribon-helix-helix transcriptional regulator